MKLSWRMAAVLACVALAATVWAGENVWISKTGDKHKPGDGHAVFFSDDGANEFDLSELADGETRIIGSGAKQVTVSRDGDEVEIFRPAGNDQSELSVTCRISSDNCKIMTFDDDPEQVMIMIEKTRECVNGVGDCEDVVLDLQAFGDGTSHVMIRKTIECDDEGDCTELEDVSRGGIHAEGDVLVESLDGERGEGDMVFIRRAGDNGFNFRFGDGKSVALRCPEGDTTMVVDKDEADDVFLCPKHSLPLEKSAERANIRRVEIKRDKPHEH